MREIKFRAWNTAFKRYDSNYHIVIDLKGNITNLQSAAGNDVYILEQFTGLKDKLGTEEYAGDRLSIGYDDEEKQIVEIYWDNDMGGFFIDFKTGDWDSCPVGYPQDSGISVEVIGNIHEEVKHG